MTDEILVRFFADVSDEQKEELLEKFETKVVKTTAIYQKLIIPQGADVFDIANKYYESGFVEFSTPNFFTDFTLNQVIPNDTYFNYQITCNNTGQTINDGHTGTPDADIDAPEAWDITTGSSNVVIAVLDEGVTSNHPDLPNSRQLRLNGSDFAYDDNDPSPSGNHNHGNACAGVIAATMNNNQGIAGIAPNCIIMPIRIVDSNGNFINEAGLADAIEFAVDNGADILSNSWGANSSDPNASPVIVTAIQYAVNHNRIVVFAAGNTADHVHNNDGFIQFPANVNIEGVITVGASDRDDHQANYSPTSDPESVNNQVIDIVAPSHRAYPCQITGETFEMWTIDIPGTAGYNSWHDDSYCMNPPTVGEQLPNSGTNYLDYTGRFGGTSHSCPVVAGVAALMLSVNSSLDYMDVFNILTSTADKVGGYTYTNGRCNEMGYGRVNAFSAVCEALPASYITGPSYVCTSNATFTLHNRSPGSTVSWSKSKFNLVYVSGQGTDQYTVRASSNDVKSSGYIRATITGSCGDTLLQKNVWVGRPGLPVTTPDGDPPMEVLYGSTFLVNIFDPPGADPATGVWSANGSISIFKGGGYGSSCAFRATGFDYGQWLVHTSNACGVSDTYVGEVIVPNHNFSMQPNPADESVEIKVERNENAKSAEDNYEIKIFNTLETVVYASGKTNAQVIRVPLSHLKSGVYYVRLIAGATSVTKQLVVKH